MDKFNKNNVGVSETDWEDVDQECIGREVRELGCPANQKGVNKQERRKVTSDNGGFEYSDWSDFINTCAYYKEMDAYELRTEQCPKGQTGEIVERRNYEAWSDGSKRNYSNWYVQSNNCRVLPSGPLNKVLGSVRGGGYPLHSLPGSPAPVGLRLTERNGTAFGLTLDKGTQTFQCLVAKNWYDGQYQSNILPVGSSVDFAGQDDMPSPAYCKLYEGGKFAEIAGSCDSTSGGDNDFCMIGKQNMRVTEVSECNVTIAIQRNGMRITSETYNICD